MLTDYHCHILPGIDDGSENTEMSVKMLGLQRQQGVERIIATPHFYAHREKSVDNFLKKRDNSYKKLIGSEVDLTNVFLGAEISIEKGISELDGIEKLAVEGTDLILLEFPYTGFKDWMPEEVHNIACEHKLVPMIAHLHRYVSIFSKEEMEAVLRMKAIFQINNEAFAGFREKKFAAKLIKNGVRYVFGSDCHNITVRSPNFDILKKEFRKKPEIIEASDNIYEKHVLKKV